MKPRKLPPCRRPKPPHDWRWVVGGIGKTLIAIGVLMFLFVGYQLWGTGIQYAQSQDELENEFDELLASAATAETSPAATTTVVAPPTSNPTESTAPTTTVAPTTTTVDPAIALLVLGGALGQMEIPAIDMSGVIVAGVRVEDLKKGVGHFPETPLPGQQGNAAIAGHRTTYGAPFDHIDQLEPGDEIRIKTLQGTFVYRVTGQRIVERTDYEVVADQPDKVMLTLVTCHPRYSARQRIVVTAELDPFASDPVQEPVTNYGQEEALPTGMDQGTGDDDPTVTSVVDEDVASATDATDATGGPGAPDDVDDAAAATGDDTSELASLDSEDAFSSGWFSDPGAYGQVALWGLACVTVGLLAWFIGWRSRYWIGAIAGFVPFMVVLYFFFQNVNRMLPPSL